MSGISLISGLTEPSFLAQVGTLVSHGFSDLSLLKLLKISYLFNARSISAQSKDPSLHVGAVIVQNGVIIATGYNHFENEASYNPDVLERMFADREFKLKHITHAEIDALSNLKNQQIDLSDATMYVYPCQPCFDCAIKIQQYGIRRVVAPVHIDCDETCATCKGSNLSRYADSFKQASELFAEHGIDLELIPIRDLLDFFPPLPELAAGNFSPVVSEGEGYASDSEDAESESASDAYASGSEASESDAEQHAAAPDYGPVLGNTDAPVPALTPLLDASRASANSTPCTASLPLEGGMPPNKRVRVVFGNPAP
jgi:deoxycytidylate deaminase